MNIREVIADVAINEQDRFIECQNEKEMQSKRSMAFFERKKLGDFAREVGIQKFLFEGKFFIRVYKKKTSGVWMMLDGKMVEVVVDKELLRVIDMMKEDGKSQDEIKEFMDSWEEGNE